MVKCKYFQGIKIQLDLSKIMAMNGTKIVYNV